MNNTWLVFDSPYLAWRAYHTTGSLSYKEIPTGVVYGYLKALLDLQNLFMTENVVHCFDRGTSLRKEIYPEYKANRNKDDSNDQEKMLLFEAKTQINQLRKNYLPEIGIKNIVAERGYEADDMIASVCKNLPKGDTAVIVSSDHDLYQLLHTNIITQYDPRQKKLITEELFTKEWGLLPSQWPMVKAIAGCVSDNIKGVVGIGEKTASKYILGELKQDSKKYKSIVENEDNWKKNIPLVKLPFDGTAKIDLISNDRISKLAWEKLTKRLGMSSIGNLYRNFSFDTK